ncbi:MAG: PAS domain-containing sensor histidine kinase [Bacteroidota bacterium]
MKEWNHLSYDTKNIDTYAKAYDLIGTSYLIIQKDLNILKVSDNLHFHFKKTDEDINDNLSNYHSFQLFIKKLSCFFRTGHGVKENLWLKDKKGNEISFVAEVFWLDIESGFLIITLQNNTHNSELEHQLNKLKESYSSILLESKTGQQQFNRFQSAVMQSANTIVITDLDGNILFANPKFEETTGYKIKEAIGKNPRILKSGDQSDEYYKNLWETIKDGKVWKGDFKNKKKDGSFYWESATITPIKNKNGEVVEYLAIKEEITERKLMEEKLESAFQKMELANFEQKMLNKDLEAEVERRKTVESQLNLQKNLLEELNENLENQVQIEVKRNREKDELMLLQSRQAAMGEMIGNIAHQWRQPLNTIGLIVYDLADAFRFGEISDEYFQKSEEKIRTVLTHMSNTIDDFRNFFKPNKEKQFFELGEMINTYVSFVDATLKKEGINLITDLEDDMVLYGYANEFVQVILNIVNNAKDAVLENKTPKPTIRISAKTHGENALITITDNGGGIPGEVLHKVFDPYFTTKEEGKGTGVGLYMSKTIIEKNMGGVLNAENVRTGAKFTITLPMKDGGFLNHEHETD